jgi:predicted RNA methylase
MNPPDLSRLLSLRDENDLAAAHQATLAERFDRLRTRHEDGTAPRAVSAFQLFQTPADLAARMVELAAVSPGQRVLEPSAGLGRIIDPLLAAGASVVAVEEAPDCARELFTRYASDRVTLLQRDFLTVEPGELFDAVVMNPPFHMRADTRHTLHALQFLRPGGTLVGLCMATRHRLEALKPLSDYWEEIPAGAFRKEGTGIATYLFRITP